MRDGLGRFYRLISAPLNLNLYARCEMIERKTRNRLSRVGDTETFLRIITDGWMYVRDAMLIVIVTGEISRCQNNTLAR